MGERVQAVCWSKMCSQTHIDCVKLLKNAWFNFRSRKPGRGLVYSASFSSFGSIRSDILAFCSHILIFGGGVFWNLFDQTIGHRHEHHVNECSISSTKQTRGSKTSSTLLQETKIINFYWKNSCRKSTVRGHAALSDYLSPVGRTLNLSNSILTIALQGHLLSIYILKNFTRSNVMWLDSISTHNCLVNYCFVHQSNFPHHKNVQLVSS